MCRIGNIIKSGLIPAVAKQGEDQEQEQEKGARTAVTMNRHPNIHDP